MSLRARLVIGLVTLAAIGLLLLGAVTYGALSRFEVGRVDDQAAAAIKPAVRALAQAGVITGADAAAVREVPGFAPGSTGAPLVPVVPVGEGGPGRPQRRGPGRRPPTRWARRRSPRSAAVGHLRAAALRDRTR